VKIHSLWVMSGHELQNVNSATLKHACPDSHLSCPDTTRYKLKLSHFQLIFYKTHAPLSFILRFFILNLRFIKIQHQERDLREEIYVSTDRFEANSKLQVSIDLE
jgi:hypothetical protein